MSLLEITIPDANSFYSLYADGPFLRKSYLKEPGVTRITYEPDAVIALYYTYPTHREACVIRNTPNGPTLLPGLSKPVSTLFSVRASKVDKLRRAIAFLAKHSGRAFSHGDGFYIRLAFLLERRGSVNYAALRELVNRPALTAFIGE